ncbi:hypothetical protein vseg_007968 [Gypsophila vaccaria]
MTPRSNEPDTITKEKATWLIRMNDASIEAVKNMTQRMDTMESAAVKNKEIARYCLSKYDGIVCQARHEEWLRDFEELFETLECLKERKVEQATFYLSGRANVWYYHEKEELR